MDSGTKVLPHAWNSSVLDLGHSISAVVAYYRLADSVPFPRHRDTSVFLLVINLVVLGWVLWREWFRHLKLGLILYVLLEVEATHPGVILRAGVLHSVPKERMPVPPSPRRHCWTLCGIKPSLTRPLDFREVVDFQQLRNLFLFAVVSVAVFSTISYTKSDHMRLLFQRLIGANIDYPTETKVDLATKDVTIKEGQSVEIIAKATGRIPAGGRLFVRSSSDSNWRSMPMAKGEFTAETADFNRTVSEIFENFTYYVRVGDAVSEKVHNFSVTKASDHPKPKSLSHIPITCSVMVPLNLHWIH